MTKPGTTEKKGMIVGTFGKYCLVADDDNPLALFRCEIRGRLKLLNSLPLAGDMVLFGERDGKTGVIHEVVDRKNSLVRPPVANTDRLVIVASAAPPATDLMLIDSLTALAYYMDIEPLVCVNKEDIASGMELISLYTSAGIPALMVSAATGQGIDELKERLKTGISVFTGNSGVGKSSLLNMLCPDAKAQTGELSEKIGRGKQTTRHVILHPFYDGYIADTPGYSAFDAVEMEMTEPKLLPECFPEFLPYLGQCRYGDCSHIKDEGCALLLAVEEGRIVRSRHESYAALLERVKNAPPDYAERRRAQQRQ